MQISARAESGKTEAFVGTIHAYCFWLPQHVARYEPSPETTARHS
jgi:hypothetical protein